MLLWQPEGRTMTTTTEETFNAKQAATLAERHTARGVSNAQAQAAVGRLLAEIRREAEGGSREHVINIMRLGSGASLSPSTVDEVLNRLWTLGFEATREDTWLTVRW
jgi:urease gamma subunit